MKANLPKWSVPALAIFFLMLSILRCNCDENIIASKPIKAPHAIALIDVNGAALRNVQKARVTIIDPDKMVVSSNGYPFESIEVTGGVMSIGLAPEAIVSLEQPYRFFIKVEADKYMPNFKTVVVTQDAPNYIPIYMAKLDELPPNGFSAAVADIAAISSGVVRDTQTMITQTSSRTMIPLSITIPAGAQLLCDGKPIKGDGKILSYRLLFGNPLDSVASRAFPGGFEVTDAVDANGERIMLSNQQPIGPANPAFFTSAGWFSLDMNLGDEAVNGFSTPVKVEMPVVPGVINPDTKEPVTIGAQVPYWSLDNRTGVWKREGIAKVEDAGDGRMKAVFETSHFSEWNLDFFSGGCPGTLSIPYANASFSGEKFTQLSDRATGAEIKSFLVDYSYDGGSPLDLIRLPNTAQTTQLVIHGGADASFPVIGYSNDIQSCACISPPPCSLRVFGPGSPCTTLRFQIGATAVNHCNNSVWYINNCPPAGLFTLGGVMDTNGEVTIPQLVGSRCVRLWYINNATSTQISLDFTVNFSGATGIDLPGALTVTGAGGTPPTAFTYRITNSGGCGKTIAIVIPPGVITPGAGCGKK